MPTTVFGYLRSFLKIKFSGNKEIALYFKIITSLLQTFAIRFFIKNYLFYLKNKVLKQFHDLDFL